MIMFLSSSAGSLGLPQISEPLNGLVSFLPRVITAIIISVAGFVIGDLVRGFVVNGASRVGLDYAGALANLVYAFILVLVLTIAISTLGVDTTLIRHTVEILLLGAAIATALALGLGMRPLAQNIVSGVFVDQCINFKIMLDGHSSGVIIPGQLGPINLVFDPFNFFLTLNMSLTGIPSVIQTANSIDESIASIIADAANFAGT